MLRILSDLTITSRVDISPASGVTDYVQGHWVLANGSKEFNKTDHIPLGCVFNMTDSDGTTGLSKDVDPVAYNSTLDSSQGGADKLTVITGPFRGVTDRVSTTYGTPSAGTALAAVSGLLVAGTIGTDHIVAVCEEVVSNFEHRGTNYATAWRFKTV